MAELINNVKMRLILPNNDQESFVNAINYNFHQLANIANHVDAKRGEKGEQGMPGAQGPKGNKGDRGPGIFTFTGNPSDLSSNEAYNDFVNKNGISEGDMIMYGGVIYNYDKTPANMDDYINDESGEGGDNKYINTDFTEDITEKIKTEVGQTAGGSMTWEQIDGKNAAFVTPKTADVVGAKIEVTKQVSLPAVFTTGLDPDTTKKRVNELVNNYSINSLCNEHGSINIRLGFEKFVDKNFATINFEEPSEPDNESSLIFDLRDDDWVYKKTIANYKFNIGGTPIASIGIDTGITSIKLKKFSIESQHGVMHIINSDNIPLGIRGDESITVFSNKSVSIGVPNEKKTFIKLDNNNNISIFANATDGANPKSSIVLNGQDPNNPTIDIKSRIVFLYGLSVVQLQSAHNSIKANGANDCDIKMSREYKLGNGEISNSYITLDKNGLLLSYFHPTDDNKSSIALKVGKDGLSTIEISSIRYILSHSTFDNLKDKNGINLDNVNIDNIAGRYYRTYLASNDTLAIASNRNILLFPGKLNEDDGNGYIHLYTDKLLIDNNMYYVEKETPGWYGTVRNITFENAHGGYLESPSFFSGDEWSRLCVKPIVFGQYITFNIYTHAYGGNKTLSIYMTEDDDEIFGQLYDYINSVGCCYSSSGIDMYNIGISLSLISQHTMDQSIDTNEIVAMCQIGAYLKDGKKRIYVRIHTENLKSPSDVSGYYDWMGTITVPYK